MIPQTVKVYVLSNGAKAIGCVIAVDDACPLDVGDEEVERASVELMKMAEAGNPETFGDGWRVVELSGEVVDGDFVAEEVWTSARILSPHASRHLVFPVWPKQQPPDEECAHFLYGDYACGRDGRGTDPVCRWCYPRDAA